MCNTDHNLICMKLRLKKPYMIRRQCMVGSRRFDVTQLRTSADDDSGCGYH